VNAIKYLIHANGAVPYLVSVHESDTGSVVRVSERQKGPVGKQEWKDMVARKVGWDVPVLEVPRASKVYAGIDKQEGFYGNTVLVHLTANQYLFIGECIFSFAIEDPIVEFYSPVGNNDVPYPFAVTTSGRFVLMSPNQDPQTRDVVSNIPAIDQQDNFSVYTHASKGSIETVAIEYIKAE
jgi:hypothetical protein